MSDEFSFNGEDDAKAEIRAPTRYLLKGAAGSDRGDIVSEIIAIVNEAALPAKIRWMMACPAVSWARIDVRDALSRSPA